MQNQARNIFDALTEWANCHNGQSGGQCSRFAPTDKDNDMMEEINFNVLTGDLKLPALLEDESGGDLPSIHSVYKELRQKVYGIIFNYHHINFTRFFFVDLVFFWYWDAKRPLKITGMVTMIKMLIVHFCITMNALAEGINVKMC